MQVRFSYLGVRLAGELLAFYTGNSGAQMIKVADLVRLESGSRFTEDEVERALDGAAQHMAKRLERLGKPYTGDPRELLVGLVYSAAGDEATVRAVEKINEAVTSFDRDPAKIGS